MKKAFILFLFILPVFSFAQDIQFSHINQTKLYLNPGFAGDKKISNLILGHRNFAPSGFGDYMSYHVSYNQYIDLLNGGLGFQLINDRQGNGTINRIYSSGMYSYHFQIANNITIQAGLEAKYAHLSIQDRDLILPNMFDPYNWQMKENSEYQRENLSGLSANYLEFNTGVVLTYENLLIRKYREFTLGLSVHHINTPGSLLTYQDDNIQRRYNFFFDIDVPLMNLRSKNFIPVFTPVFLYQIQGNNMIFNYGGYLNLSDFHLGVFFRHNQAINYYNGIFHIGVDISNLTINYSYDASLLSKMKKNPFSGAHEVTLSLNFQYKRNK